jgi:hypothetical protein
LGITQLQVSTNDEDSQAYVVDVREAIPRMGVKAEGGLYVEFGPPNKIDRMESTLKALGKTLVLRVV